MFDPTICPCGASVSKGTFCADCRRVFDPELGQWSAPVGPVDVLNVPTALLAMHKGFAIDALERRITELQHQNELLQRANSAQVLQRQDAEQKERVASSLLKDAIVINTEREAEWLAGRIVDAINDQVIALNPAQKFSATSHIVAFLMSEREGGE